MFNLFETEADRAQRENNEGQKDAAKAGFFDQLAHDLVTKELHSKEYNEAYDKTRDFKSGQETGQGAGLVGHLMHDLTSQSNSKAFNDGFDNGIDNKPSSASNRSVTQTPQHAPTASASAGSSAEPAASGGGSPFSDSLPFYERSFASHQTSVNRDRHAPSTSTSSNVLPLVVSAIIIVLVVCGLYKLANPDRSQSTATVTTESGYSPVSQSRKLTRADLAGKTRFELDVLRNEIYARHGYRVEASRRRDLAAYFNRQGWYHPNTRSQDVAYGRFSTAEKYNVGYIRKYELAHGMTRPSLAGHATAQKMKIVAAIKPRHVDFSVKSQAEPAHFQTASLVTAQALPSHVTVSRHHPSMSDASSSRKGVAETGDLHSGSSVGGDAVPIHRSSEPAVSLHDDTGGSAGGSAGGSGRDDSDGLH